MSAAPQPTSSLERIPSLDFLRGIAILGILFINIENFAYPDSWSPWKYGFESSIDHTVRFWVYFITQGKFYTLFALLFGVGFYIFLERQSKKHAGLLAIDIYARRLFWLFLIGVCHAYVIWSGDVLYHYAICGFLLFPFRSFKTKNLIWVIGCLCLLQLVKSTEQTVRRQNLKANYVQAMSIPEVDRSADDAKNIRLWSNRTMQCQPDTTQVSPPKPTFIDGLKSSYEHASVHEGMLYYKGLLIPSLIVMLLGIVFYRAGIFIDYTVWKHYWWVTFVVLILGLTINFIRYYHWTYAYFDPVTELWKAWLFTFPKEVLGVGYALLLNGLSQKFLHRTRMSLNSKIGKTALSNYLFQNILLGFVFYGYGLALYNQFSRFELLWMVGGIWFVQLVITYWWMQKHSQGPVEWLWRKLTYSSFRR
ncbi:DUF418 domain-containing protein [Marinoscillum furvescens]|uniref:DUF418 domain-containing protein n=1 Tax=Marinoscillum furvescens DSM 4134 TaxID=1122208 RepID=A0A3D9KWY9_MARFU|nr:DUF418 domain-containing protein [Marinoscillum furvescens]RED91781.1 uncharacterized protein C7460_13617 [Marinoscillum furvescens DSM 4134]